MSSILDRYSSAVQSSNLKSSKENEIGDLEILGAAGLASKRHELGIELTRLFTGGRVEPVVQILARMAYPHARYLKIKMGRVQCEDLARSVIAYYKYGTCQPCGGIGYTKIAGAPSLGAVCTHCKGTGRRNFDRDFKGPFFEVARWLAAEIDREQAMAGVEAMRKLAGRMEGL